MRGDRASVGGTTAAAGEIGDVGWSRRASGPVILAVLTLGVLDLGLEQSIVLPALPGIARAERVTPDTVAWLVTGYLLAAAVALPLFSRLGDLFGRRRMLVASLLAFGSGSLVCALSGSLAGLIAGRVVQGIGAAVAALAIGVIRDLLPRGQVPVAVGLLVAAAGAGYAVGLVLGGVFVDRASVAAIFWFLLGASGLLLLAVLLLVPDRGTRASGPVDWLGAALLAGGTSTLLLAISKGNDWAWGSARTLVLLVVGVALLVAFAHHELRARFPLVDVRLMASRSLAGANVAALTVGFGLFIAGVVIPQLATLPRATGYGLGLSATGAGLILLPGALAIILFGALGGRLVPVVGARALVGLGTACAAVAYVSLALRHGTAAAVAAANGLLGAGTGLSLAAIATLVVGSVAARDISGSIGVNGLLRIIGSALGAQIAAAVITAAGLFGGLVPKETGFTGAFVLGAVAAGLATLTAVVLPARRTDPARSFA